MRGIRVLELPMTSANTTVSSSTTIQLSPSYRLPLALVAIGVPLCLGSLWVGLPLVVFGVFLMVQTLLLRLHFTPTDLDIYRGETLIRRFPYQDWQNWQIFWSGVPILFYFKEVKSIHFLPILFDPQALQTCLEQRCPRVASSASNPSTPD